MSRLRAAAKRAWKAYRNARIRVGQPRAEIVPVDAAVGDTVPRGAASFDPDRAFELLRRQVELGSRAPGTPGHEACLELILRELAGCADEVAVQRWDQRILRGPGAGRTFPLTNVFARVRGMEPRPDGAPELMLCTHWDTRPVADVDPDPAKRTLPVPGASDGASGVAVLMDVARALRVQPPATDVVLAFWDGEDLGEYYYGSRLYGKNCSRLDARRWRPRRAVLVDMIGGARLRCVTERNSLRHAPEVWRRVHDVAARLGLEHRFNGREATISDDHLFLNRAGIPSIVLIDGEYPFWHTTGDTVEHCAPESLQAIGDVLLAVAREHAGRSG